MALAAHSCNPAWVQVDVARARDLDRREALRGAEMAAGTGIHLGVGGPPGCQARIQVRRDGTVRVLLPDRRPPLELYPSPARQAACARLYLLVHRVNRVCLTWGPGDRPPGQAQDVAADLARRGIQVALTLPADGAAPAWAWYAGAPEHAAEAVGGHGSPFAGTVVSAPADTPTFWRRLPPGARVAVLSSVPPPQVCAAVAREEARYRARYGQPASRFALLVDGGVRMAAWLLRHPGMREAPGWCGWWLWNRNGQAVWSPVYWYRAETLAGEALDTAVEERMSQPWPALWYNTQ